jgi:UDP-glucose 4-epimerase
VKPDYIKLFDLVHAYLVLVSWLEEEKGALSAGELFGGAKRSYRFRELREYVGSVKPSQELGQVKKRKAGEVLEMKTAKKAAKGEDKAGGSRQQQRLS